MTELFDTKLDYDLDSLFTEMEEEAQGNGDLVFLKKGDSYSLFMLPPAIHDGVPKIFMKVEGEYQGKPTYQYIVRFGMLVKGADGKFDLEKTKFVGITLPKTCLNQLVTAKKDGYNLGVQNCHPIIVSKNPKTELRVAPKEFKVPNELWERSDEPTWETLLQAYAQSQAGRQEKLDEVPFE